MQVADTLGAALDSARAAAGEAKAVLLDATFWLRLGLLALRLAVIVALALLVLAVVRRIKRRWVRRVQNHPTTDKRRQRVLTVADLLGSVAKYVVWGVATIMLLEAVGFDVGPLLAGAGIAGLAIGFGAQTLVKDVISGLFLLFDGTIGVGDLIRFNQDAGEVEYVGLRLIKVRKFDGELLMIPAGELRVFGNKSIGFARAIVDVGLSYEQDVNEALRALEEVTREWAETEAAREAMIEEAPQVQAVTSLGDSAVTARVVVQVRPGAQFQAERDLRRLIKARFDELGVEIPFPRRTVYVKSADGGGVGPDEAAAAGA
jgi:small conductance mechanosensitive channel